VTSLTGRPIDLGAGTSISRRGSRIAAVGASIIAAGTLLTACDKPRPTVTVYSGSTSRAVSAQQPCVLTGKCSPDPSKYGSIKARSGGQVLVDVPKSVADAGWIVTAFTTDGSGKNTALSTPGASTTVTKALTTRLQVPQAPAGGSYFLQVNALSPSTTLTTWIMTVQITQ
jgi:hypothetical protein